MRNTIRRRRGITAVQTAVILGMIIIVSLAMIKAIGNNAKTALTSTSGNVADPSTLPARFGS